MENIKLDKKQINDKLWEMYQEDERLQCCQIGRDSNLDFFLIVDNWDTVKYLEDSFDMELDDLTNLIFGVSANWGFNDEWTTCSECDFIIHSSEGFRGDGWLRCEGCFKEDIEDLIEEYINNPKKAVSKNVVDELENIGFMKIQSYENSWHANGGKARPDTVFKLLSKDYHEIVFVLDREAQFETRFSAYARQKEEDHVFQVVINTKHNKLSMTDIEIQIENALEKIFENSGVNANHQYSEEV
jgi:hypothetical protein